MELPLALRTCTAGATSPVCSGTLPAEQVVDNIYMDARVEATEQETFQFMNKLRYLYCRVL